MPSKKATVFETLFNRRWDTDRGCLTSDTVTLEEVVEEIVLFNAGKTGSRRLSQKNPANFYKDFTRKVAHANGNWPPSIRERGFTAVGVTGQSRCFKFVPIPDARREPFVGVFPEMTPATAEYHISSACLPLATRQLARSDEAALIQTLVRLRVVEAHMALFSPERRRIIQVDHLQNSVKLRDSEIDALFLAVVRNDDGGFQNVLITFEAKQRGEDLMVEQVSRQPLAVFDALPDYNVVIAIAARSYSPSKIQLVEFSPVRRETFLEDDRLRIACTVRYVLEPRVDGIGGPATDAAEAEN